MIREACHEVQRPVFYAIAIIITAYMPIFTLQRVEGRLFRPMAWTVAFALLGAMTFSILIAPVLAVCFSARASRMAQPGDGLPHRAIPQAGPLGLEHRWCSLGRGRGLASGHRALSDLQRSHRRGVPAASGRGRHLGARHSGQQHRLTEGSVSPRIALCFRIVPGSDPGGVADRPAR
jgi:multidrug efflux pump subunit AcrB